MDTRTQDFKHLAAHMLRMMRKWPDEIAPEEAEHMNELLVLIAARFTKEAAHAEELLDARTHARI